MSKDLLVGQDTTLLGIQMIAIDTVQGPTSFWVPRDEVENYINTGAKRITQNGTYDASSDSLDGYSTVTVNVPPNVGVKQITQNGTYQASSDNLDGFSSVSVNVDATRNLGTKLITSNGKFHSLQDNFDGYYEVDVAVKGTVLNTKQITANGNYKATDDELDGYSEVDVNVEPNVGSKAITANGNYEASSDNYDGYSSISVNVPPNVGSIQITENGTYTASSDNLDGYSTIEVNVAEGSDGGKQVIIVKEDGSIEFPSEEIGETLMLQDKTVTSNGVITPDSGYSGFRSVTVAVSEGGGDSSQIIVTDEDGNVVLPTVTLGRTVSLQQKTATSNGLLEPDAGYDGFSSVMVDVSGGSSEIDRSLMNNFYLSREGSNSLYVSNDWAGPFNSRYTYMRPGNSTGGFLKPNWSEPFEIKVQFSVSQSLSRSMVLFGAEQGFYYCPSIEVQSNNSGIWCGLSSTGSSWTRNITFTSSDGVVVDINTTMYVIAVWDGTDYTVTFYDGSNAVTKSITPTNAPYFNDSYNLEFGGISKSDSHFAQYVKIDLLHTYIKENNVLVWGCDAP